MAARISWLITTWPSATASIEEIVTAIGSAADAGSASGERATEQPDVVSDGVDEHLVAGIDQALRVVERVGAVVELQVEQHDIGLHATLEEFGNGASAGDQGDLMPGVVLERG
jgi:hypothetical protein